MSLSAKPHTESDTSSPVTPPVTPIPTVPEKEVEKKAGTSVSPRKFDFKTDFQGRDLDDNVVIRMKPKGKRFAVTIPGKLSVNSRRTEIGFSHTEPFGIDTRFASYLRQELETVVGKWKSLEQARKWVQQKSSWRGSISEK